MHIGSSKMLSFEMKHSFDNQEYLQLKSRSRISLRKEISFFQKCRIKCGENQWLKNFFNNIAAHISPLDLKLVKKYSTLDDGIYILLSGKAVYIKASMPNETEKKQNLLNLAKMSSFTQFPKNTQQLENQLSYGYSILIQEPLSVLEVKQENITTLEEVYLIKIGDQEQQATNFRKLKEKRKEICERAYLHGEVNTSNGDLFKLNYDLHHSFKFLKFPFGNKIKVNGIAIIKEGRLRKKNQSKDYYEKKYVSLTLGEKKNLSSQGFQWGKEIESCGIILPGVYYEVISHQAVIMSLQENPTVSVNNFIYNYTQPQPMRKQKNIFFRSNKENSKKNYICKVSRPSFSRKRHEEKQYRRDLQEVTQKCDQFTIISMYACQKQTQAVKNILEKYSQKNKEKQKNKYKSPTVLFDFAKSKTNKIMPSLKRMFEQNNFSSFKDRVLEKKNDQSPKQIQNYQNKSNPLLFTQMEPTKLNKSRAKNKYQSIYTPISSKRENNMQSLHISIRKKGSVFSDIPNEI